MNINPIQSVSICEHQNFERSEFRTINNAKFEVYKGNLKSGVVVKVLFNFDIFAIRDHDYTWTDLRKNHISSTFSPKLLQLTNGALIQPNLNIGYWHINVKKPKELVWELNPPMSRPISFYTDNVKTKHIISSDINENIEITLYLLYSKHHGIEISRSKLPFKAIVCFTDHCDFDTFENLIIQRQFFKKHGIKVSKGFFLSDYSIKNKNLASWENHESEYRKWVRDGHELCYHSLTQSIKSEEESKFDFLTFTPPSIPIFTYIDHGFQPYNLSLYKSLNICPAEYSNNLVSKNIQFLWNYIDCGSACSGIINQLNANQFSLSKTLTGLRHLNLKQKVNLLVKNIFTYHIKNEIVIKHFKLVLRHYKLMGMRRARKDPKIVFKNLIKLIPTFLNLIIKWPWIKNKTFFLAKYTPLIFKHSIENQEFYIFQTVEMTDFKKGLSEQNLDLLIKESGVFIAHTYFSVPHNHHSGRFLKTKNTIDGEVSLNFQNLGKLIKSELIWNPTVSELISHLILFESIELDVDDDGLIFIKSKSDLITRNVLPIAGF